MPDTDPQNRAEHRRRAISRWDNEGGALAAVPHGSPPDVPILNNADLVHLRVRVKEGLARAR
jgi:hypothetical protein